MKTFIIPYARLGQDDLAELAGIFEAVPTNEPGGRVAAMIAAGLRDDAQRRDKTPHIKASGATLELDGISGAELRAASNILSGLLHRFPDGDVNDFLTTNSIALVDATDAAFRPKPTLFDYAKSFWQALKSHALDVLFICGIEG